RTVHGRLLPVMDGLDCRVSSIGMTRPWKKFRHPCFLSRVGASSPRYTECANLMEASDSVKFAVAAGRRDKAHAAGGSAVADAVDAAGLVVRHEQRPVGHHEHVRGTAAGDTALEPSSGERLIRRRAVALDSHERDAVANR